MLDQIEGTAATDKNVTLRFDLAICHSLDNNTACI